MNAATSNQSKKMSSAKFSEYVMGMDDLFKMADRNGYYLPKQKSQAINEIALFNILQGKYWCPKVDEIRIKNCVTPPTKDVILAILLLKCQEKKLNLAWIDEARMPDKKWMVDVLATLDPSNEIFAKDYVAPPIRKRHKDIETIALPDKLFKGLPVSTSKLKSRRLKITSEAFAAEKIARMQALRKDIGDEIIEQEQRRERYVSMFEAKDMFKPNRIQMEEDKMDGGKMRQNTQSVMN